MVLKQVLYIFILKNGRFGRLSFDEIIKALINDFCDLFYYLVKDYFGR